MAYKLPFDNNSCSNFTVTIGNTLFNFRSYWSGGVTNRWLCDIRDGNRNELLTGIALVTGTNDLIKGCGIDILAPYRLFVVDSSGSGNRTSGGFGSTAIVYMAGIDEDFYKDIYQ